MLVALRGSTEYQMPGIEDGRPDPDVLLERVQRAQERAARGRLRIYFGSSAGVGKTYAMLAAGHKLRSEGRDVLVGVVETHGRAETRAMLEADGGLPLLPTRAIEYKGHTLQEFDLDATLARKPELLLLDEFAHSNVPGSRHPKRWQDAEEILAAGIDVFTTLNVQHLESLNDVVGNITGVRVFETIPDTVFDSADEVVMVDLTAEELLKRLADGKVYIPEQAVRASKNFFRRGNLMALRELALRRTADRVEEDLQTYRSDEAIHEVWKTEASMVCGIGPGGDAENVVRATARLASQTSTAWHAVYVETPGLQRLPEKERERILQNLRLAQELGAQTSVLAESEGDTAARLVEYARAHNVSRIVFGRSGALRWMGLAPSLARRLAQLAPEIDLIELGHGAHIETSEAVRTTGPREISPKDRQRRLRYLWAFSSCVLATLLAWPLAPYLHDTNIAMLYLLPVAVVAMRWGRGPATIAAVLNVAAFDFFFVPPKLSFAVSDIQYVLTFGVMLAVGLMIAELTARVRYQARVATHREERARVLYEFSRELSSVIEDGEVIAIATRVLARAFRADVRILVANMRDQLEIPAELGQTSEFEPAIASWAYSKQQAAGMGTDTLPGSNWLYLPLKAPMRTRGVVAIKARSRRLLMVPEQMRQLDTFATLVAIALERVHYVQVAQQALVGMESERLRNSLLSAFSHDLRTPLAAVVGLADSLTLTKPGLSEQQTGIVMAIVEEGRRMTALVNNLLDMARIESGEIRLNLQWQPLEEIVGAALRATAHLLSHHQIETGLPEDLPLLRFDGVLMERVLINLLENAAKYTPAASTIRILARVVGRDMEIVVEDDGPGLPRGKEEELFAKFARGDSEATQSGVGLGLAICRAIIGAHGGTISAQANRALGAGFVIVMPLGEPPAVAIEALESSEHG